MEPEVLSLFVQMVDSGASLAFEAFRRKKSKDNLRLSEALRALDTSAIAERIDTVELATMMQGAITAAMVRDAFARSDFKALARELFVVVLAHGPGDAATHKTVSALTLNLRTELGKGAGADDAEAFAEALSDRLVALSTAAIDLLNESDPSLLAQMQQTALLKRVTSILEALDAHHAAVERLSDEATAAVRANFFDRYRRACVERHGYIVPPDFETNRKVPMQLLYVAPSLKNYPRPERAEAIAVGQFVGMLDRTVVLGDPGGGKSTLSGYIASTMALDEKSPIPIHVTLRHFAPHSETLSLLDFIEREVRTRYQVPPVDGLLEDTLLSGNAVVIFDGLDELIDATKRREVTRSVEIFGGQYPLTPIMVTSRRVGYEQARLDPALFQSFVIDGFEDDKVQDYVHKWFSSQDEYEEHEATEQAHLFIEQSEAVPDLRTNPLMLALMCIIFRGENYIPRNRPAVYEKCARLLFEKWDGHRGIEVPLQARDHVDAAMKFIAYNFITTGSSETGMVEAQVVQLMAGYLHPRAVESEESATRAAQEFVDYCAGRAWVFTDAGATGDGKPIFAFTHRTFMEYFAAVHLTRVSDNPEVLARTLLPHVAREEWDVVAQLAIQQVDSSTDEGTKRVLTEMLNEKKKRSVANRGNVLRFIARCLAFAVIPPSLVRQIASACVRYEVANRESNKRPHTHPAPLNVLRYTTHGLEAQYAAEQVREDFRELLQNGDHGDVALRYLFDWTGNDQLGRVVPSAADSAWRENMLSLIEDHEESLRAIPGLTMATDQLMCWFGMLPTQRALETIAASDLDFNAKYFRAPQLLSGSGVGVAFSEIIYSVGMWGEENMTDYQQEFLSGLADMFVNEFFARDQYLPDTPDELLRLSRSSRVVLFSASDSNHPQPFLDALVLLSIVSLEIFLITEAGGRRESMRTMMISHWRDEDGAPLGRTLPRLSDRVREFATAWIDGNRLAFSNADEVGRI